MAGPYTYAIGPVPEVDGTYQPPTGCISWVDLRSLGQQSALGQTGCGFFTMPSDWSVPGGYHGLGGGTGDLRELSFTLADQSAWAALIGTTIPRDASTKLIDALRLQLTDYSVPDGSSGPKPLQPGSPPPTPVEASIYLSGHSRVWGGVGPTLGATGWGNRLRDLIRNDLQRHADEGGSGRSPEHWRKVMGGLKQKYGLDWDDPNENDFLPPGLRGRDPANPSDPPGKRRKASKPETRLDENFNGADKSGVGYQLSWTNSGKTQWSNVSNRANISFLSYDQGLSYCRADSDLSSSDHEVGATLRSAGLSVDAHGPAARYASSADTMYAFANRSDALFTSLVKVVAGTRTELGSAAEPGIALNDVVLLNCNGSTITGKINGTDNNTLTDTAITTGTRGGLYARSDNGISHNPQFDDWYAQDLAASVGKPALFYAAYLTQDLR